MKKRMSNMNEVHYTECYVAFLDVLGFKTMLKEKTAADVYRIYEAISVSGMKTMVMNGEYLMEEDAVKVKVMSDSVLAYIPKKSKNALMALIAWCMNFQYLLLLSSETVLIRGAIASGDLYSEGDITYGQAFVDAYCMEEQKAKMPRVILEQDIIKDISDNWIKTIINSLVERDKDGFYFVDYTKPFEDRNSIASVLDSISTRETREIGNEKYSDILKKNAYVRELLNRRYKILKK